MKKEFKTFVKRGPMWEEFERLKNSGAPIIRDLIQDDSPIFRNGWGNGYVIIPKGHFLYRQEYDVIDSFINVHGGLTFSDHSKELNRDIWGEIPKDTNGWVVGFDTGHYNDNETNWPKSEVINETYALAKQLQELKPTWKIRKRMRKLMWKNEKLGLRIWITHIIPNYFKKLFKIK